MGWGDCGDDSKGRPIGYVHEATCDHPGCEAKIHRGLAYACGGDHDVYDYSCEGYFCQAHRVSVDVKPEHVQGTQACIAVCRPCYEKAKALGVLDGEDEEDEAA